MTANKYEWGVEYYDPYVHNTDMTLIVGIKNRSGVTVVSDGLSVVYLTLDNSIHELPPDTKKIYEVNGRFLVGVASGNLDGNSKGRMEGYLELSVPKQIRNTLALAGNLADRVPGWLKNNSLKMAGLTLLVAGVDNHESNIYIVAEKNDGSGYEVCREEGDGSFAVVGSRDLAKAYLSSRSTQNLSPTKAETIGLQTIQTASKHDPFVGGYVKSWLIKNTGIEGPKNLDFIKPDREKIISYNKKKLSSLV